MTARNERAICIAAVVFLWLVFFVQALHTPTLLDDWYQLTWHRTHAFGLSSIWQYAHYNYFHFNPRIGDVLLLIVNGPRAFHLVLTPLVQLALLPLAFAVVFARWPKPTLRDLQLLLVMQVLIWLVIPIPGIIYFYRPFATNYLWAFAIMLGLFAPYRLALGRDPGAHRIWLVPFMLVLGWCAGMGNEHTGPTAMVAMAAFLAWAWQQDRLRAWMIAGAIGLYIGYPMLFFAPGQAERYAGIATKNSPIHLLLERGLDGNWDIVLDFIGEAQIAIDLVLVALLLAARRAKTLPELSRTKLLAIAALIATAGAIVVTLFASPTVGERLFFAPAVLFVGALVLVADWLFAERAARRFLVATCAIVFAYHVYELVAIYAATHEENQHRLEILEKAKPDTVAIVPPYGHWKRTRWWWGDDFQYASLREYIANEVYDLKGIEYDRHLHWSEPTPPDHFVATRTFDPPLASDEDAKLTPRYVPTFWEWALVQLRRRLAMGPIGEVERAGHKLVHYTVDVAGSELADPRAKRVLDWTPGKLTFVDGRQYDNPAGTPYIRVWAPSVPTHLTDTFVVGCGRTQRVEPAADVEDNIGPLIPITLDCRGTYSAFMCDPETCWLAGRYWR
jgi:hypothetical protein